MTQLKDRPGIHKRVILVDELPNQDVAEELCDKYAETLMTKVFVTRDNVRIYLKDFSIKQVSE